MMAVVWPRRRTKSRSWRVASSASAKRNQACWKAQTASPSVWGRLPAPSVISGRWERTASIRSRPVSYTHLDVYKRQTFRSCPTCSGWPSG